MLSRRAFLAAGGMLVVGLRLGGRARAQSIPGADRFIGKPLAPDLVDSYLAVHADGSVTIFVGKVDIGTGGRIAMRQIVGEELDLPPERIAMIEGDTALTPNQGATAGSYGIARGGVQLRQAAATARQALLAQAAQRLNRPAGDLQITGGVVSAKDGSASVSYGDLLGDRAFNVKLIQRLDQPPLGVGEAASTPVPAALANAVFDATGVRLRTVPFRADRVKAALARS